MSPLDSFLGSLESPVATGLYGALGSQLVTFLLGRAKIRAEKKSPEAELYERVMSAFKVAIDQAERRIITLTDEIRELKDEVESLNEHVDVLSGLLRAAGQTVPARRKGTVS